MFLYINTSSHSVPQRLGTFDEGSSTQYHGTLGSSVYGVRASFVVVVQKKSLEFDTRFSYTHFTEGAKNMFLYGILSYLSTPCIFFVFLLII